MKNPRSFCKAGFSLAETVIAILVVTILLSGFMVVFAPAAAGIRKAINAEEAGRLVATVEQELVTLRGDRQTTEYATGFHKAFDYIKESSGSDAQNGLIVYKYRSSLSSIRDDGTADPITATADMIPGEDYIVQTLMRRNDDPNLLEDIPAMEGVIYMVKCTQLVMQDSGGSGDTALQAGEEGVIVDTYTPADEIPNADSFPHAVISFKADFHALPAKSAGYFSNQFSDTFTDAVNPVFSRNLAVRR